MKTYLIFNTEKLIKKINSKEEFYKTKVNGNRLDIVKKYHNKKGSPFSTNFPKEIKISPEVVGLIVGEGFIGKSFVFANSNEKAIDEVSDFLKQFNIPLKFYLEISVKNKDEGYVNTAKSFWENHLNIKLSRIRLRKEFNSITKYGTIHLILSNSLFSKLLRQIMDISKIKVEKNKDYSINYLKGIIAAEGNINIKKSTKCVYMIRISASKKEERNHYKRCLEKVGIKIYCEDMPTISADEGIKLGWKTTRGRAGAVIISRWDNFIKIFELDLLDLHNEKKEKFLKYFFYNKFTKQFLEFEYFLNKRFTLKEAQNYFGFKGRHVDRVLTFYKNGYLNRKKVNEVKFSYSLTNKYKKLHNKLKNEIIKQDLL
jgi:methyl coenzyme M reductase subunit D